MGVGLTVNVALHVVVQPLESVTVTEYEPAVFVVMLILPTISETPGPMTNEAGVIVFPGFPAVDMYEFRLYTLGTQVIIFTTIGLVSAALFSRLLEGKRQDAVSV